MMTEEDRERLAELERRESAYRGQHGRVVCHICDMLLGHIEFEDATPANNFVTPDPTYVRVRRTKGLHPLVHGDCTRVMSNRVMWRVVRNEITWQDSPANPDAPAMLAVIGSDPGGELECPRCNSRHHIKHPPASPDRSELRRLRRRRYRAQGSCIGAANLPQ